ncbi:MAG TPA: phosphatase PAP2 family protein [Candidatus Saccharimonadales bacterium]|nr:phosphatase PAP2 family protein [Candidatus Saccharimonadales bacterium]
MAAAKRPIAAIKQAAPAAKRPSSAAQRPSAQRKQPTQPPKAPAQSLEPEQAPRGHYWWYVAAFVVALTLFAGATVLALSHKATGWEYTWFREVNNQSEGFYRLMTIITFLGSTWGAAIAVLGAYIARYYRLAWRLAFTIIGAYGVTVLAKHFIERPRPLGLFEDVHARVAETGMGFPSGHTMAITVITLTLLPYLPWKLRWIIPILIVAVGISRLYLGVHIPLDLVGGLALGTAAVAFVRILPQRLRAWAHLD